MLKKGNKVRLREDTEFKNGKENVRLSGSDQWPPNMTLVCFSDENNGCVGVAAPGITAHLLAERLRLETPDDLD